MSAGIFGGTAPPEAIASSTVNGETVNVMGEAILVDLVTMIGAKSPDSMLRKSSSVKVILTPVNEVQ